MTHSFVTIAIPFDVKLSDQVEQFLDWLGTPLLDDHVTRNRSPLRRCLDDTKVIHFMSITVVRGDDLRTACAHNSGNRQKPEDSFIVIEASVDGRMDSAVATIAEAMRTDFDQLLATAGVDTRGESLAAFFSALRHDVGQGWFAGPGLNYDGTPGMTVERIVKEARLADKIVVMLDADGAGGTALDVIERVRRGLWHDGEKWAFIAEPAPCLQANTFAGPLRFLLSAAPSGIANLAWPFLGLLLVPYLGFLVSFAVTELRPRWAETFLIATWILVALVIAEIAVAIAAYLLLRHREKTDISDDIPPRAKDVERLMKRETFGAQNHLASSSIMKPGALRHLTLRIGLWFAGQLAAYGSRPSFLGPTGVIHFARWILLPGTNKLLFMSNYDGAWETYLEDFIEKAHQGVTGIWSNTQGFPTTENLLFKGATDGDRLRRWTRRQQHPSWVWYVAYPELTLSRIRANAAIRQGIATITTEADAADWLACFGSSPRPSLRLQLTEMPTLVLGGLGRLRYGTCIFLRLSSDPAKNKQWLAGISDEVSYGDQLTAAKAMVVGFAQGGLKKLGLRDDHLGTFPVAFQQGNAAPWRARTLGDVGPDDPKHWIWGAGEKLENQTETLSRGTKPENQADTVMLIYADNEPELLSLERAQIEKAETFGTAIVFRIRFKDLPEATGGEPALPKEPFGFRDGVSNPIIRGIRSPPSHEALDLVNPGEFVLGYPDNLGYTPPSPGVSPSDDLNGILPSIGADLNRQRPDFSLPQPSNRHDLGMNGTFLVVRQLEQDADAFNDFFSKAAALLVQTRDPRVPATMTVPQLSNWLGAKMVGRWRDGTSLIRNPHAPGTHPVVSGGPNRKEVRPDNNFLFASEDPNGLRCPFGAHIRRANPRDSFAARTNEQRRSEEERRADERQISQEERRIVNRHRILRVGRPYGPQNGLDKPGILFMCLNADIERQFEFVQQSWVLGPSFLGLLNEIDPILGNRRGAEVFSIPTPNGTLRITGIQDFVRVRGGGYFFLPGKRALRYLAS